MSAVDLAAAPAFWKVTEDDRYRPFYVQNGREVEAAWAPQPGSQVAFLTSPIFETLIEGNRGGGKTAVTIMSFAQHCGKGFGPAWRGILFRRHYADLEDVWLKCEEVLPIAFPGIRSIGAPQYKWIWPGGERLTLAQMDRPEKFSGKKGHEYPWVAFEELTEWEDDRCYRLMISTMRSPRAGMPRMLRSTTNPAGPGHNWVKDRFRLPVPSGRLIGPVIEDEKDVDGNILPPRVAIHSSLYENRVLLHADPEYITRIAASAPTEAIRRAWIHGDWEIVSGGMFDDVWDAAVHVVDPFPIPRTWRIDRAFDWGSSKPFSVGWWAESDGSDYRGADGRMRSTVRGDLFRVAEWYGFTGRRNEGVKMLNHEIARGIVEREIRWGLHNRVQPGPADTQINNVVNGTSIALEMSQPVRLANGREVRGVTWTAADKSPGSRVTGWEQIRQRFRDSVIPPGRARERSGLFVFRTCQQFIYTVPSLTRDERDTDDIPENAEDHIADETRYRVQESSSRFQTSRVVGLTH